MRLVAGLFGLFGSPFQRPFYDREYGKAVGGGVIDRFACFEVVEGGREVGAGCQGCWAAGCGSSLGHFWFVIVEVDAGKGLGDVELAGLAALGRCDSNQTRGKLYRNFAGSRG